MSTNAKSHSQPAASSDVWMNGNKSIVQTHGVTSRFSRAHRSSRQKLWPIVEDYLNQEEILQIDFKVNDPDLIPREKFRAFLEEKLKCAGVAEIEADLNLRLQNIYSDQTT